VEEGSRDEEQNHGRDHCHVPAAHLPVSHAVKTALSKTRKADGEWQVLPFPRETRPAADLISAVCFLFFEFKEGDT